jgi:hypothetical protein
MSEGDMAKGKAVFGIYSSQVEAENAVQVLKINKFNADDISVLLPDHISNYEFGHQNSTKVPEGIATGASTGAVIGGVLGWLVGAGILSLTGFGALVAAGPLMTALAGVGVGGTIVGLAGALIGFGVPEYEARRYEGHIMKGGILLSVHVEDSVWRDRAKHILDYTGAKHISVAAEIKSDRSLQPIEKEKLSIDREIFI